MEANRTGVDAAKRGRRRRAAPLLPHRETRAKGALTPSRRRAYASLIDHCRAKRKFPAQASEASAMKPTLSLAALGAAFLVAACSTAGSPAAGPGAQASNDVQWKEVTRLEGGQFVTYRVPVTRRVNNDINFRPFDPTVPAPDKSAGGGSAQGGQAQIAPGSESAAAKTPPLLPLVGSSADAPLFGSPPASADQASAQPKVPTASNGKLSGEAATALGQAEIAVRDAQSCFETAKAALDHARNAAQTGDN